jgi:hypothetical protein
MSAVDALQANQSPTQVDLSAAQHAMTQQRLHTAQRGSVLQQMGRAAMAQLVHGHWNAQLLPRFVVAP